MIITRAPLRVSFAGGGTDIPAFYRKYGPGVVISTAISRYVYISIAPKFDGKMSIRYRIHENVDHVDEIKHPLIREILKHYGIESGVEIVISSEVPARGSGLGASSALAVALCLALERWRDDTYDIDIHRDELAHTASEIEINKVGSPIGRQDHYASALGGVNRIDFLADDTVAYNSYTSEFLHEIESQSMLFYLGMEHEYQQGTHFVQKILKDQNAEIDQNRKIYELQRDNAIEMWDHLIHYENIERFMDHINQNWRLKKSLHQDISNPQIEQFMERAFRSGAIAAKVSGAGGGGFAYLLVPPSMQDVVREELKEFKELKFLFAPGAEVLFSDGEAIYANDRN